MTATTDGLGSDRTIRVDVRTLAATNRDLKAEMADGNFREDLFYRLNVVSLQVPPVRDRIDDIPLLADYFPPERRATALALYGNGIYIGSGLGIRNPDTKIHFHLSLLLGDNGLHDVRGLLWNNIRLP